MGDVFNSGIPCPSINEDGIKHVIFLKKPNRLFCLFDYLTVGICPSLQNYRKEEEGKGEEEELSSTGHTVNLSVFSSTFYPMIKREAEK